ncbi:DHHC-type zinc finger family protein [Trifolium repens]|nr:DHHC-type zinc finger family protein [Trifolium repens]
MHPPAPATANSDGGSALNTVNPSLIRTYRAWKGNNVFFLRGRFIFGPDVKSIFTTLFLVIAPVAVFCAFVARKLLDDFPHHSGYSILIVVIVHTIFVLIALVLTSGRDPGIVPRNSYPPVPDEYDGSVSINSEQNLPPHLPRSKEVIINGIAVKVKYCDTCMLYRPPRCSHCSICDNCVERFDHHCPWVGQCIGLRNYRFYYMFVFSATLLCLYIHGFCWVYIKRIQNSEEISIWKAMIKTPASIALIIYSFFCIWFVGGLTVFHTYLISTNQSTYENFRYRYDRQVNPYNKGIVENFKEVFFSSIPPSKNNFRTKVPIPKESTESSRRRGVDTLMMPVYNEVGEVEKDYKDEEYGKGSELNDTSVDLSSMLHTERGQRQVASFLRQSLWERSSRKWEVTPEVLDEIHEDGESKRITGDSSKEPVDNPTKTDL